jgi:thiosulfate/3-mercaptopyruvate sulfurtransferase
MKDLFLTSFTHIISSQWLSENLKNPNLVILDVSIPSVNSINPSELTDRRIPNARFFDLKNIFSDQDHDLPAMMPTPESFQQSARELGINRNSQIVIYDNLGIYSSPRVWWMFRAMGHENVVVLDGGLPEWNRLELPTESIASDKYEQGDFVSNFQSSSFSDFDKVNESISTDQIKVIDARSEGRFNGTSPEPRAELRSGSIPHSINLPFGNVLEEGKMLSSVKLKSIFEKLNIRDEHLIFTCGSGVTACIILLAAEVAGFKSSKSVYDGAWSEWATIN